MSYFDAIGAAVRAKLLPFGPCYRETDVPDSATMPRITYDLATAGDGNAEGMTLTVMVWDEDADGHDATITVEDIADSVESALDLEVFAGLWGAVCWQRDNRQPIIGTDPTLKRRQMRFIGRAVIIH